MRKMVIGWIEDLKNFGETYIGNREIVGTERVVKNYNALAKEVKKQFNGMVLAFDIETGEAWLA